MKNIGLLACLFVAVLTGLPTRADSRVLKSLPQSEVKAGTLPGGETRTYRGIRPNDPQGRDGLANPERGFRLEIGVGRRPKDVSQFKHLKDWSFPRYKKDGVTLA